jgi:hypothetical protein
LQTILEKLVALTETINTIKTNAKKNKWTPAQSVLIQDPKFTFPKREIRKIGYKRS